MLPKLPAPLNFGDVEEIPEGVDGEARLAVANSDTDEDLVKPDRYQQGARLPNLSKMLLHT